MVDVARLAGVSQPTVSFVVNDRRDVSVAPETRRRVLDAARALDYRPNRSAQDLRMSRSTVIGVVTNGIASQPFAGQTISGIQRAAKSAGLVCIVVDTADDPDDTDAAVTSLVDRGVAAIVYASPNTRAIRPSRFANAAETVFANCWPTTDFSDSAVMLPDEYQGGRDVARAVFARGHRRVAYLGGTPKAWASVERGRGFVHAAAEAGVDPSETTMAAGNYSTDSGYDLTREVFTRTSPTAVVCGNDRMALGALLALRDLGLRVPSDVTLTGYDDQEFLASELRPRLTTVALPFFEMGYRAGEVACSAPAVAGRDREMFPCRLIERESISSASTATTWTSGERRSPQAG